MKGIYWWTLIFKKSVIYLMKVNYTPYTHSVLIRNGPIRNTSEIFGYFKKWLVKFSKLRNPSGQFFQSKKQQTFGIWVKVIYMLTRNPEGQEELITQLWQQAICKLYEIQCSIHHKYDTRKKKYWVFLFCKKLRHTIKFWKKIRNSH